jgi:hypothetical protein
MRRLKRQDADEAKREKREQLVSRHDRPEHDADPRVGVGALGDGMVPGALAGASNN